MEKAFVFFFFFQNECLKAYIIIFFLIYLLYLKNIFYFLKICLININFQFINQVFYINI